MDDTSGGAVVGIDLGTTFSLVGFVDATGRPMSVINAEGDMTTPSVVFFDRSGVVVGKEADKAAEYEPERVARFAKRDMGKVSFHKSIRGEPMPPEVIQALILKKLKEDAELKLGPISKAVVTVPAYFDEPRRKATEDAARLAGIELLDILNEPTAAAISFGVQQGFVSLDGQSSQREVVLVYDLGGGTFDVTLMEIAGKKFNALGTAGDVYLGGVDWTDRIVDHVGEQFMSEHNIDPRTDECALQSLINEAEDAKRALTAREQVNLMFSHEGCRLRTVLTREWFEKATADLVDRTVTTVRKVLREAKVEWKDVTRLLLVGGSSRIPAVQAILEQESGLEVDRSLSPDEAVGHGAAVYAALLAGNASDGIRDIAVKNVSSHDLGVLGVEASTGRKRRQLMIPRNSPLPCKSKAAFKTAKDNQPNVVVNVIEGGDASGNNATKIGKCVVTGLPSNLPRKTPVEVTFRYGANGRMRVSAFLPTVQKEAELNIERASGLSEEDAKYWTTRIANGLNDESLNSGSRAPSQALEASGSSAPTTESSPQPASTRTRKIAPEPKPQSPVASSAPTIANDSKPPQQPVEKTTAPAPPSPAVAEQIPTAKAPAPTATPAGVNEQPAQPVSTPSVPDVAASVPATQPVVQPPVPQQSVPQAPAPLVGAVESQAEVNQLEAPAPHDVVPEPASTPAPETARVDIQPEVAPPKPASSKSKKKSQKTAVAATVAGAAVAAGEVVASTGEPAVAPLPPQPAVPPEVVPVPAAVLTTDPSPEATVSTETEAATAPSVPFSEQSADSAEELSPEEAAPQLDIAAEDDPELEAAMAAVARQRAIKVMAINTGLHALVLVVLAMIVLPQSALPESFRIVSSISSEEPEEMEDVEMEQPEMIEDQTITEVETDVIADTNELFTIDVNDLAPAMTVQELADSGASAVAPVSGEMGGRSKASRSAMVTKYGGTAASEAAVGLGLIWLKNHQRPDGSWNYNHLTPNCDTTCSEPGSLTKTTTGSTAMALLTYMGAGSNYADGEYQKTVEAALNYLLYQSREVPAGLDMAVTAEGNARMYVQGLCAAALSEATAINEMLLRANPKARMIGVKKRRVLHEDTLKLKAHAQAAINFIVNAQCKDGGWAYQPGEAGGDTSVVGWQMMALMSARSFKATVPARTFIGASAYLDKVRAPDGAGYGYRTPGKGPATSAIGLLCRMYMGWKRETESLKRGVLYLSTMGPAPNNMYYKYYASQVMHHYGDGDGENDKYWTKWNDVMREQLVSTQIRKGHGAGSWNLADGHGGAAGRLYMTCLATMTLEIYYRHLPLYDHIDAANVAER